MQTNLGLVLIVLIFPFRVVGDGHCDGVTRQRCRVQCGDYGGTRSSKCSNVKQASPIDMLITYQVRLGTPAA